MRTQWRTQASLALSVDGIAWTLINASPDLRRQIECTPCLHPRGGVRTSGINAVLLTGTEVDQIAGLLSLRERQRFALYGTAESLAILKQNTVFDVLAAEIVSRVAVPLDTPFTVSGGAQARLFAVPGKPPLYLERGGMIGPEENEISVGVEIYSDSKRLLYVPSAAAVTSKLMQRLETADVILFDGTLYDDEEMIRTGTGSKTGRRMGHMPIDGPQGSLALLSSLPARRIYTHLNNTNPVLINDSPQRRRVEQAGWEIAYDGLEIVL